MSLDASNIDEPKIYSKDVGAADNDDFEFGEGEQSCLDSSAPYLTAEQWVDVLNNPAALKPNILILLSAICDIGGSATCAELADAYGEEPNYYLTAGVCLGKCANKMFALGKTIGYWHVPFLGWEDKKGRSRGSFVWQIRPELTKALEISDIHLPELSHEEQKAMDDFLGSYTDKDFLNEIYMTAGELADLKHLLKEKKNIILQGAPGTGKTFAAERLAWALMGEKDQTRVEKVQFHQNTSYDDFVIGYKPNVDGGFEVKEGPFVTFCEKASADAEGRGYYFIIDEINRANISKVFGELLMLIENSHRGESVRLGIDGREFSVPKNVYIIGMMNTADRGLALIDYALRRRFAFYEMTPALSHPKFKERINKCKDKRLPALVDAVIKLNKTIAQDPSLDEGFCIGHSYFCKEAEFEEGCAESIVKYELAPLIREYWFDDKDKAANEIKNLEAAIRG